MGFFERMIEGVRERARAEARAERQRKLEAPEHPGIKAEFERAKKAAARCSASANKSDLDTIPLMQHASAMAAQAQADPKAAYYLEALYLRNKIRITAATPNRFIPLLKLVAPEMAKETRRRSSLVLDYAQRHDIPPDGLAKFIDDNKGITACAAEGAKAARPDRAQKRLNEDDARLEVLRRSGRPLSAKGWPGELEEGLSRCLIERRNGRVRVLSVMKDDAIGKYRPLTVDKEPTFD